MSTPGRAQKLYTIEGEPGYTTTEVAARVCQPGTGLTYNTVSKRLQRGLNTWAELSAPVRNIAARERPADPSVPPRKWRPSDQLAAIARRHADEIAMSRMACWLSWRGPVEQGQLVARIAA